MKLQLDARRAGSSYDDNNDCMPLISQRAWKLAAGTLKSATLKHRYHWLKRAKAEFSCKNS